MAEDRPPYYETIEEFKQDLAIIKDSLLENKAEALLTGEFAELLEAVEVFGFSWHLSICAKTQVFMKPVLLNC